MQQTTQDSKFYLNDLYPSDGEVGNAFLGKNIANNFTRLLAMGGTVVFANDQNMPVDTASHVLASVPLTHSEFRTAPVVQLWKKYYGEAHTYGTNLGPMDDHPSFVEAYFDGVNLDIRYMGMYPEHRASIQYRIFGV